jgi:hypothetical protein
LGSGQLSFNMQLAFQFCRKLHFTDKFIAFYLQ